MKSSSHFQFTRLDWNSSMFKLKWRWWLFNSYMKKVSFCCVSPLDRRTHYWLLVFPILCFCAGAQKTWRPSLKAARTGTSAIVHSVAPWMTPSSKRFRYHLATYSSTRLLESSTHVVGVQVLILLLLNFENLNTKPRVSETVKTV